MIALRQRSRPPRVRRRSTKSRESQMRSHLRLITLLGMPLAVIPQSTGWEEFAPKGGHFKVMLPARHAELPPLLRPVGAIPNPTFLAKLSDERFRVSYYCFSEESTDLEDVQTRLQGARNRTVVALTDESRGLKAKHENHINQHGIPGLEINMDSRATSYTARIFVSERCVFLLLVSTKIERSISEDGKRFLDSFELLP